MIYNTRLKVRKPRYSLTDRIKNINALIDKHYNEIEKLLEHRSKLDKTTGNPVIYHFRGEYPEYNKNYGITIVFDRNTKNQIMMGVSVCSNKDQFNKRLGVELAKERMVLFANTNADTPIPKKEDMLSEFIAYVKDESETGVMDHFFQLHPELIVPFVKAVKAEYNEYLLGCTFDKSESSFTAQMKAFLDVMDAMSKRGI